MKSKIVRWGVLMFIVAIIFAGGYGYYLWNMPHRNVQAIEADFEVSSSQLVQEFLTDSKSANKKYLSEDGDSKILAVEGVVASIDKDMNDQNVVVLKGENDKAGVSCTFTKATNTNAENLNMGDKIILKGVIRSGAGYDEDLELYEEVILEKCDVVAK